MVRIPNSYIPATWLLALACSCGYPDVQVDIRVDGAGYIIESKTCGLRAGGAASSGFIVDDVTGGSPSLHCELVYQGAPGTPVSVWRYGSVPPGYKLNACAPLSVNHTYRVSARALGGGFRYFTLSANGTIQLGRGSCHG